MNMIEKLNKLMQEKGINRSILSKESGIPYTTIDGFYKKGTDNVKLTTLKKLSSYFSCSLDYLVDDDIDIISPINNIIELTDIKEEKLLNSFNKLNEDGKDEAIKRVDELTELSKYKKETVNGDDEFTKVLEARKRVEEYFKENPHLMPIASHDKDGDFTEEDYKHDEDIMKNDDLWK